MLSVELVGSACASPCTSHKIASGRGSRHSTVSGATLRFSATRNRARAWRRRKSRGALLSQWSDSSADCAGVQRSAPAIESSGSGCPGLGAVARRPRDRPARHGRQTAKLSKSIQTCHLKTDYRSNRRNGCTFPKPGICAQPGFHRRAMMEAML